MPFIKGRKVGHGKSVGTPNYMTADMRDTVRMLLKKTLPEIEAWIHEIKNPKDRITAILGFLEYGLPKLARIEHTAKDGEELKFQITWDNSLQSRIAQEIDKGTSTVRLGDGTLLLPIEDSAKQ
jgi:hypothetical protein